MPFIQLDRQFVEWDDKDPAEAEAETRFLMGRLNGSLDWPSLLKRHRVVILAEAGSGKSKELTAQAELQGNAGNYAFCTTVQEVARDGLPGCLGTANREQFEAWKASQSPAWIFVDSMDQAKLDNIRLDAAFRKLADGIGGAARRAYVVLSRRHTDWEFRADWSRLARALPVPQPLIAPPTPKEALERALRNEHPRATNQHAEAPLVVLIVALQTEGQAALVRIFELLSAGADKLEVGRKRGLWAGQKGAGQFWTKNRPNLLAPMESLWLKFWEGIDRPLPQQK